MKKKRSKRPAKKIRLIFDENERKEFLTGFQKRKKERQKKAQEELKTRAREEKRRLKVEKREILQSLLGDKPIAGSSADAEVVEDEPVTYDMPDHTVTVTNLDSTDLYGDVRVGNNTFEDLDGVIEHARDVDSQKRRLKALDRKMGYCSQPVPTKRDKREKGKLKRIKLRTTKKAKLARSHR